MSSEYIAEIMGFDRCTFEPDGQECDVCDTPNLQLYYRRTCYDVEEGEYLCIGCIEKRHAHMVFEATFFIRCFYHHRDSLSACEHVQMAEYAARDARYPYGENLTSWREHDAAIACITGPLAEV